MARVWACGFELGNNVEVLNPTSGLAYSTSTVRSGTYSAQVSSLTSGAAKAWDNTWAGGSTGPAYQSVYINIATLPSAENRIFDFRSGGTSIVFVTLDSGGLLRLYDEDGAIGSASSSLSTGSWHKIDLHYDKSGAAGSHTAEARLNNSVFATSSTRSLSLNIDRAAVGGNLGLEAQTQGTWYFDDWKLNNSSGSFENGYPGGGKIIHLKPNATGDNNDWTRGGSDSGSNFGQVDEVAPNDATDYVTSNTTGQIDDYNLEASGLSASDAINVVSVCMRQRGEGASANASYVLRVKASASGTVAESGALTPSSTGWRTNRPSASPVILQHVLYDLPGSSTTAWTNTDLDSAQIGVRLSASNTNAATISTLWMLVDYIPGASSPSTATIQDYDIYESGSGGYLASHTLPDLDCSGSNSYALAAGINRNPLSDVTSWTFEGAAPDSLVDSINTSAVAVSVYGDVVNDADLTIISNTPSFKLQAMIGIALNGVDQSTPIAATDSDGNYGSAASKMYTGTAGNLIIAFASSQNDRTFTPTSGMSGLTSVTHADANAGSGSVSYATATGSPQRIGLNLDSDDNWRLAIVEVNASSATPPTAVLLRSMMGVGS